MIPRDPRRGSAKLPQLNAPSWALRGRDVFAFNLHSHWKQAIRSALSGREASPARSFVKD